MSLTLGFASSLLIISLLLAQKPAPDAKWILNFAEEFDGSQLDLTRWGPHDPLGQRPAALTVSGGQLHLASGSLSTFGLFGQTYGRFEIRCKIPFGRGMRASFRLLPVKLAPLPAIDVFEVSGSDPSSIVFANRWGTEQTERSYGDSFDAPDLSAGFHVIAAEWERDKIVWSIDGKEKFKSGDGIPRESMFLLIDFVAGTSGTASFDIDYVRVYRQP